MAGPVKRVCLLGAESTGKTTLAAHSGGGVRHGLEPRVRAPLHRDRPRSRRAVDERRVHPHRADPVLVRGLASPGSARERPLLRHRRVHDGAVPPGLPRRAHARLRRPARAALRPDFVCGMEVPWKHDGIREFEEQRHWMHERYLERAAGERVAVGARRGAAAAARAAGELRAAVDQVARPRRSRERAERRSDQDVTRSSHAARCRPDATRSLARGRPRSPTGSARCGRGRPA